MKTYFKFSLGTLCMALALALAGCNGEDGAPGPAGATGTAGDKGDKGDKGPNGTGFDEAAQYGKLVVYLDGKRPDNIAFKDTMNFLFSPTNADDYSYAQVNGEGGDHNIYFYVERFLAMDNYETNDSHAGFYYQSWLEGTDTVKIFELDLYSTVLTSDFKYFELSDSYYDWEGVNVENTSLTNYSYNMQTGSFRLKFSFLVLAEDNDTGYDLNVSGYITAKVFQHVGGSPGRHPAPAQSGRISNGPKAVMRALN
jgi:hypothetical protein